MRKITIYLLLSIIYNTSFAQSTVIQYLSGTDKDHTVNWDFFCTDGRNSGRWTTIPVPSNWELQGFGSYNYGHDKQKSSEQGIYKHTFLSGKHPGKRTFIVFEGSMTDTKVMINGKLAGPVHQGAFYRFKYDITNLLKPEGKNLLEVTVDKTSANASVNLAERKSDFWILGGIFRPVYLEIVPERFIDRVAINAKADGSFEVDVFPRNLKGNETIDVQIQTLNGKAAGAPFSVKASDAAVRDSLRLTGRLSNPRQWTAEFPNLYQAQITIRNSKQVIHRSVQKFGFRTVELRKNDGLYVNGKKIILKGSNRHSFWPESGRTLSHAVHLMDAKLMKEMNMNAVRMSHYPPDQDFLHVCDSIGLYVIDELTGWQSKYDTVAGRKLVKELIVRDVNHPSILMWANGNEGGWNRGLDNDYAWYDPQKRTVIHPYEKFNGTDTHHYPDYNYMVKSAKEGQEVYFPTEFMHGLYDGGAGAGLDDFWNQMLLHPHGAGGFIWAFVDEGIVRTDKNGILDTDGNHGADGIVGPHREKEGSFFTIKEIWSPVFIGLKKIDSLFDRKIEIENRYDFTNLNQCTFKWKLVNFPQAKDNKTEPNETASGSSSLTSVEPGAKGSLDLKLPASWNKSDALFLTAYGPDQKEIYTWTWAIKPYVVRKDVAKTSATALNIEDQDNLLRVKCDGITYQFDKATGYIQQVMNQGGTISLSGGPVLAGATSRLKEFKHYASEGKHVVEADYDGPGALHVKWTFSAGSPAQLDYQYAQTEASEFSGITFNYPESKITAMKWMGRGQYRVWKNRMKGQQLGVWYKKYNNTLPGESWQYPEFKGYHAEVSWVVIENQESPFRVYTSDKDLFFQMLKPAREKDAFENNYVQPAFPEGSLGFLTGINAIGNKFHGAKSMGPESQKNEPKNEKISRTLWFDFSR
ncbi:beta-galactosidase [Pedobacter sp. BAL39]|uniref:glycoside hydrolase family 2 TIM barrel-domain containing protein n=1 Tax=Pedobacter sp. BAL39 TaxID=391596 RepID=UPI00015598A0|nr:glycoside hydrolase family 2 TIM barrel-domain containing protein [Pedobacter sp. BAL39]EDM38917.1 beta-galactosidase [Pedobacter sp. BAL39]